MSFQLRQLQLTVDYITNQLIYANERKGLQHLTNSDKKWMTRALLTALDPIQQSNPTVIVINKDNNKLKAYFDFLAESNILFPENVTYLIKRKGTSYECNAGNKKEIYNKQKARSKKNNSRINDLTDALEDVKITDSDSEEKYAEDHRPNNSFTPQYTLSCSLSFPNLQALEDKTIQANSPLSALLTKNF